MTQPIDPTDAADGATPVAVVHKQILDAAKQHPDASIERLADEVDAASEQVVERVLDRYGDPAAPGDDADAPAEDGPATDGPQSPTPDDEGPPDGTTETETQRSDGGRIEAEIGGSAERVDNGTKPSLTGDDVLDGTISQEDDQADEQDSTSTSADSDTRPRPDLSDLTAKQREVLRAIRECPGATQSDLAEQLEVSRTTISKRVNGIEGFEWSERREFVETLWDDDEAAPGDQELDDQVADLADRVKALERAVEAATTRSSAFDDPDLASRVVRACVAADDIAADEEVRIIAELIESGRGCK